MSRRRKKTNTHKHSTRACRMPRRRTWLATFLHYGVGGVLSMRHETPAILRKRLATSARPQSRGAVIHHNHHNTIIMIIVTILRCHRNRRETGASQSGTCVSFHSRRVRIRGLVFVSSASSVCVCVCCM